MKPTNTQIKKNNNLFDTVQAIVVGSVLIIVLIISSASLFLISNVNAQAMSSTNYHIQSDSVNFGGGNSSSTSYTLESTAGEIATGDASSTNYTLHAGYQQMHDISISASVPANITMSPALGGVTGGTSNGSTNFTVITDDQAGYTASIKASSTPALISSNDSFADYVPAGASPDFAFSNAATASSFAFSPEGTDIDTRYMDNGVSCNTGSSDTSSACWDGLSTLPKTILTRASSNHPIGTVTTVRFRAASGSSHIQKNGVYTATTTITVLPL